MLFEKKRQADYRRVFNTPEGAKGLADLCQRHFIFHTTHVPGDSVASAFQEGRRSVVMDLIKYLRTDLETLEKQMEPPYDRRDER